ncbi:MAG: hypothetical protein ACYCX4_17010 [Bacillota bacterium]
MKAIKDKYLSRINIPRNLQYWDPADKYCPYCGTPCRKAVPGCIHWESVIGVAPGNRNHHVGGYPYNGCLNHKGITLPDSRLAKGCRHTAYGSGYRFAMGALKVAYEQNLPAEEVARLALEAAAEFDDSTGAPFEIYKINSI